MSDLPNVSLLHFDVPALDKLEVSMPATHRPRILILYGSLRERSFSRFLAWEAARLLEAFGAETQIFDPRDLPLPDGTAGDAFEGARIASARRVVGRSGVVLAGAPRCNERHPQISNRLDTVVGRRGPANAGEDACRHVGVRRLAVVQRGQSNARSRTLDADAHNSEPIVRRQGFSRVR